METQSLKNSLTKMALLSALGIGGMTAMTLNQTTVHADTQIDATHVKVDAGDTLYKIAQNHHTTVQKLAADNNISNPASIKVGQVLSLDGQSNNNQAADQNQASTSQQANATQSQSNYQNNYSTAYTSGQTPSASVQASYAGSYNNSNSSYSNPYAGSSNGYTSSVSGSEAAAKEWIAQRESGGSYSARNNNYIGRYQLSASYLNGDYSPANQERVADQYVANRYGNWVAAQRFWQSHGWY